MAFARFLARPSVRPALRTTSASPRALCARPPRAMKSEDEWRKILSPEQFRVLRQKGTEYPGTGEYNKFYPKKGDGAFVCGGCGTKLYDNETKFDSGCGWPAFYQGVEGKVKELPDADGMRVEIVCANCGGHLGHVFRGEGFDTPTNARHCVNSVSLKYVKDA